MKTRLILLTALVLPVFLPGMVPAQTAPAQLPSASALRPARITRDRTNIRRGPGAAYKRILRLNRDAPVTVTGTQNVWTRIRLPDGQEGWLLSQYVRYDTPAPSDASVAAQPVPHNPGLAITPNRTAAPLPTSAPPPPARTAAKTPPGKTGKEKAAPLSGAFKETRPDPAGTTQESPAATLADAWRMLFYLLPVLLLVVLAVRAMKAVYQRTGALPSLRQGLLGGFHLVSARRNGGSRIRVIESVPLGATSLHLIGIRDRLLLIGATGGHVSVLTEFRETSENANGDFASLMNAAEMEMEEADADASLPGVVGSLDDVLREAHEAIVRNTSRIRRWKDGGDEREGNHGKQGR
jgi:flagellar biogenesis protein FliO